MTDVTGAPAAGAATGRSDARASAGEQNFLDYEAFLRLLTTQLTNQDPTAPMDSTEYIAQLAAFSQVEQAVQTNRRLDALLIASALGLADSVIGRTVTSADGTVSGVVSAVRITDEGPVATLADGERLALGSGITVA